MLVSSLFQFLGHLFCSYTRDNCFPYNQPVVPELTLSTPINDGQTWRLQDKPIVSTNPRGGYEGYIMETIRGRRIAAFEGIRYGQPPTGPQRFRMAQPVPKPHGIIAAKKTGSTCLQMDGLQYYRIVGREDCLFLNVYTPNLPTNGTKLGLPVIIFIHGGGHFFGAGDQFGPAYFLDTQEIILVTINYRVGVLGYLSTGDEASPGNNGLKDQALAIKWVQNTIEHFGGDLSRLSLMGQSAGATSVGLHLISAKTRDIPYTAITHSGSTLSHWAIVNHTIPNSRRIAEISGCPTSDSFKMVDCLRAANPYFLVERQMGVFKRLRLPIMPFGPVVERPSPDAYLTESPEVAYRNQNVSRAPKLIGFLKNEGDFLVSLAYVRQWFGSFRTKQAQRELFPILFEYDNLPTKQKNWITRKLINYYMEGSGEVNFWKRNEISEALSDKYFINPARKEMEWHSKVAPTYGFFFNYYGKHTALEGLALNRKDWGISHIDDLQYLFNSTYYYQPLKTADEDYRMVEFLTNVWGNFASKRAPHFTRDDGTDQAFWQAIESTSSTINLLEINTVSQMSTYPYEERYQFWRSLNFTDDH